MKTKPNKYKYIQEWKKRNPEKIRQYREIWRKKHYDIQKERLKKWREKNPDYMRNYMREYYKKHPRVSTYIRKSPADLYYERNKLIYQARTIQKLKLKDIGKMFRGKEGKPLSKQRIEQIVVEFQKGLDRESKKSIMGSRN